MELVKNFHRFVIRLRVKNSIEPCNIFNMDEMPVWFDMAGNITINPKGEKTVYIRGTGNEKNWFTVVLICAADGTKLPLICIFKRKFLAMMVFDSFRGHLEKSVKQKFNDNHVNLAVIPGDLTSICQPLDVAINKPFKDHLRRGWHSWMTNGGARYIATGNLKCAKISEVYNGTEDDAIYEEIDKIIDEIQNENENKNEEMENFDLDGNESN
ncbi:hypothetical protein RclHR1_03060023 [Rhizophagus clarus]|uniref:DDE-1 domain-containing protein n=1 Tax=Rhizophagus clarus TaxID=94130 RepID=A0A2Z6S0B2_9GLOM|nr:hypothetical protein RclHR1_03060023 [Rhizophagus clarus]